LVAAALLGLACSAPSGEDQGQGQHDTKTASEVAEDFIWDEVTSDAIHHFTQRFYSKYLESKSVETNLVFSPFSIHLALAMLSSAATPGSTTQEELLHVLGGLENNKKLEKSWKYLLDEYRHKGSLSNFLEFGNAVWATNKEDLKPTFTNLSQSVYYTDVMKLVDADTVNSWVSSRTNGKIKKLFEQLSPDIKFLLTNVVYFHDSWVGGSFDLLDEEFDPIPDFKLFNGKSSDEKPKWMQRSSSHFVLRNITFGTLPFKAVSIPYEHDGGNRFDMVLLVPAEDPSDIVKLDFHLKRNAEKIQTSGSFIAQVNAEFKKEFANSFEEKWGRPDVTLTMPFFSLKGSADVADILKKMNVKGIFNDGKFGVISDEPLKVGNILHKAVINVDTEGTEAAAATGIELVPLSAFINSAELNVDRPFMFIIRDKVREVPLFVGKVMDPTRQE